MSGRRSYVRFNINPPSEGVLQLVRDVIVQSAHDGELVVIGREAGIVGDDLMLGLVSPDISVNISAKVVESTPIVIDGGVRHRIRLQRRVQAAPSFGAATPELIRAADGKV